MNRRNLIIGAIIGIVSITFYSCKNADLELNNQNEVEDNATSENESEWIYKIESRFITTITKEKLDKAKSIADLLPKKATEGIESLRDVRIVLLDQKKKTFAIGVNGKLNKDQLALLQTANYSTNFCIEAFCDRENPEANKAEGQCFVYYVTIVPEQEAKFENGNAVFIESAKEKLNQLTLNTEEEKIQPGKISFTITMNGEITNVSLTSTSGYSLVDKELMDIISNTDGKWHSAKNSKGENIDQELVFFYGKEGC